MRKLHSDGDTDDYSPGRGRGGLSGRGRSSKRSDSSDDSSPRTARSAHSLPPNNRRQQNFANHDGGYDLGVVDPNTTETYMGEWKNDLRSGFGETK